MILVERKDVATGNTCALNKDVTLLNVEDGTLFFSFLNVDMRDNLEKALRGETLVLPATTVDGKEKAKGFLEFGAVAVVFSS